LVQKHLEEGLVSDAFLVRQLVSFLKIGCRDPDIYRYCASGSRKRFQRLWAECRDEEFDFSPPAELFV
jgi:hypothetical protein